MRGNGEGVAVDLRLPKKPKGGRRQEIPQKGEILAEKCHPTFFRLSKGAAMGKVDGKFSESDKGCQGLLKGKGQITGNRQEGAD